MAQDPYQELGVPRGASAEDIRKAFRKLAKKHHPDANRGDKASEEKFKRLSAAFDLLGDPEKRRKFDAGEIDAEGRETARAYGNPFGHGGPGFDPGAFRSAEFENIDLGEILGEMFGGRGGGQAGPGGRRNRGFASRGQDVRARVEVDLEEAIRGGKTRLTFTDGRVLDVTIPKGAAEGQVLRLKGQGQAGPAGAGDLMIEIAIRPHPLYRREGDSLVMDLPISVPDAVLGGKAEAPTPEGPVSLTIPKGTNSGARLRLKGRGLSDPQGRRGDLFARLIVTLPEGQDAELEKIAQAWRSERPYSPKRRL